MENEKNDTPEKVMLDFEQRLGIIQNLLETPRHACTLPDLKSLKEVTEGFFIQDLGLAIKNGIMYPMLGAIHAEFFKMTKRAGSDVYEICQENDEGAIEMDISSVPRNQLYVRPMDKNDLVMACRCIVQEKQNPQLEPT